MAFSATMMSIGIALFWQSSLPYLYILSNGFVWQMTSLLLSMS